MAKQTKKPEPNQKLRNGSFAVIAFFATYGFASLAIDTGSLWHYAFTFAALYFAAHYTRLFLKEQFFNNDKTRKSSKAR